MPLPATIHKIDRYWAAELGCDLPDLKNPKTVVVQHGILAGYKGMLLLRRGPACVVSAPATLVEAARAVIGRRRPEEVFQYEFLKSTFGTAVDRIIGPAWYGYADATDFHGVPSRSTRLLGAEDDAELSCLANACTATEWEHSGIERDRWPIFGCYVDGNLVAASTLRTLGGHLHDIGVVTHPEHRGKGYAKAVVSTATSYGLANGSTVGYRTLRSNSSAIAVARSLGYKYYASTIAVRLATKEVDKDTECSNR